MQPQKSLNHTLSHHIGEMLEWLKRHAWKACKPLKGFTGSNPVLSASSACMYLQALVYYKIDDLTFEKFEKNDFSRHRSTQDSKKMKMDLQIENRSTENPKKSLIDLPLG